MAGVSDSVSGATVSVVCAFAVLSVVVVSASGLTSVMVEPKCTLVPRSPTGLSLPNISTGDIPTSGVVLKLAVVSSWPSADSTISMLF